MNIKKSYLICDGTSIIHCDMGYWIGPDASCANQCYFDEEDLTASCHAP